MAEIWGAAIAVGGAVISGVAASKKAKEDRAAATSDRKAATKDEAIYGSILSQFEAEQDDYYNQLDRSRKQRGLDQFRSFNTVSSFAPQYAGDNPRIVVPNRPNINTLIEAAVPQEAASSGGSKKSLLDTLDPIGAKLKKVDPVRKALGKLF